MVFLASVVCFFNAVSFLRICLFLSSIVLDISSSRVICLKRAARPAFSISLASKEANVSEDGVDVSSSTRSSLPKAWVRMFSNSSISSWNSALISLSMLFKNSFLNLILFWRELRSSFNLW